MTENVWLTDGRTKNQSKVRLIFFEYISITLPLQGNLFSCGLCRSACRSVPRSVVIRLKKSENARFCLSTSDRDGIWPCIRTCYSFYLYLRTLPQDHLHIAVWWKGVGGMGNFTILVGIINCSSSLLSNDNRKPMINDILVWITWWKLTTGTWIDAIRWFLKK